MKRAMLCGVLAATLGTTAAVADHIPPPRHERHRHQRSTHSKGEFSITLGVFEPRGQSDLWEQNSRDFTVSPQDYDDAVIGARVGKMVNNHFAVDVGASYMDGEADSIDRRFTDAFGDPIRQESRIRLLPIDMTLKLLPFGRYQESGHAKGRLRTFSPYLGIGAGAVMWKYSEEGDFVDPVSLTIFPGKFSSRGIAGSWHWVAGADVTINKDVSLFVEGRGTRADDDLSSDFAGFDEFDLSTNSLSMGAKFRF